MRTGRRTRQAKTVGKARRRHLMLLLPAMLGALVPFMHRAEAAARIKDIVAFEGVRENMLIGYGLVVGLNGTGDKLKNNAFTQESLISFLERQGVNTRGTELKSKNVAAVTVTAMLPPFSRNGSAIDVSVSAMGDAKDLQGGTLLATPLYGADGEVYAVAQGSVSIGGFKATSNSGTTITKGVPTNGFIPDGGIVEREIVFAMNKMSDMKLALRNPDITTAKRIAEAINVQVGPGTAVMTDPGTVTLKVPAVYDGNVAKLLADIEQLPVDTDQVARIVIDEASGTIVMGENVRIDTVAVAQGNLVVKVEETPAVSQPGPFAPNSAQTVVVPQSTVTVDENPGRRMAVLERGATLRELVGGLNALGVGPRDLITILQTIKAAGALQAEIETR
jgi:flagellar P-ring protein precursor FlgI